MAAKKKSKAKDNTILGYNPYWMKDIGEEHPDYEKVMKEAKKQKFFESKD